MDRRFSVEKREDATLKAEVYVLRDAVAGSTARVAPSYGGNLYSLSVPIRGEPLEAFLGPEPNQKPGVYFGTPVLFPWPSNMQDGRFTFLGKQYQVDVGPSGMAMHGLVNAIPWRVENVGPTDDGARLTAFVASEDHPNVGRQYPFPFRLALTFTLRSKAVRIDVEVRNTGDGPMPFGFGLHPWFRLPLSPHGDRRECLVKVPGRQRWVLGPKMVMSGERVPVPPEKDFHAPRALGDLVLDGVFTDLGTPGGSESTLTDPAAGATVVVRADPSYREWVAYVPSNRPTICLEPWTCTTDAINLAARGVDSGMLVVQPGDAWRSTVEIAIADLSAGA